MVYKSTNNYAAEDRDTRHNSLQISMMLSFTSPLSKASYIRHCLIFNRLVWFLVCRWYKSTGHSQNHISMIYWGSHLVRAPSLKLHAMRCENVEQLA